MEFFEITQKKLEWLGYELFKKQTTPLNGKVQALTDSVKRRKVQKIRSYFEALNQITYFYLNIFNLINFS